MSGFVSVVLVNYNGWRDTIECLESVLKMEYVLFNVYVVDNSSGEENINCIEDWAKGRISVEESNYPDIIFPVVNKPLPYVRIEEGEIMHKHNAKLILIRARENKGFAAGNNVALSYIVNSEVDYVWLLNNDCVVIKQSLNIYVDYFFNSQPGLGMLGCTLKDYYNGSIQAYGGCINTWFGTTRHVRNFNKTESVDYPIGASLLISKEFLQNVGLMSEDYFLYYEEMDWVERAKKSDYKIELCKLLHVYHKEGGSTKGNNRHVNKKSYLSDYYGLRSRVVFMRKYYPRRAWSVKIGLIVVLFNRIRRRRFKIIPSILNFLFHGA